MDTPYVTLIEQSVHSTQDYVRVEYEQRGGSTPVLVMAHEQSAGRGRHGSEWWAAPRALLASLALPSPRQAGLTLVPLLAGMAAHDAIAHEFGRKTSLKWPNDVLVGQSKVGGVLAEVAAGVLVVGCGINIWWPDAPEGVAALAEGDPGHEVVLSLGQSWAKHMVEAVAGLPETFHHTRYIELCDTIGRAITWTPAGSGRAIGIGPDGALIVETESGTEALVSSEVSHVRQATMLPNAD